MQTAPAARSAAWPAASVSAVLHLVALAALSCVIVRPTPPPQNVLPSFAMVMEPATAPSIEQALPPTRLPPAMVSAAAPLATPPHLSFTQTAHAAPRPHVPPEPVPHIAAAPINAAATPPPAPAPEPQLSLAGLESRIRQAVQEALIYPAAARLLHREGRTRIRFDYTNGSVGTIDIATSSTSAVLDRAALDAVRRAALPRAPAEIGNRRLAMLVWVDFRLTSQ